MKITTTTFVVCFIINSFPAFAESEFILDSKAKKSYKETIECIKSSGNNISVCLKETITYIKSENKLLKTYKKNKKGIKRKQNIINFLKKSSDKFVGKYKESRNNKDYKQSLNTTKVYYAVTKDEDYKKIIEELKSLGKGGTASDIMAKLLEKMPIGNEYDKYVNEYNKRVLVLKDDIKKKTIKYGEDKIDSFIKQFNETITDIKNNILISSRISYSEYIIAIKTDRIDTRESNINNLQQQIINLVNENNDNIISEYNNIISQYKSYDFKDLQNLKKIIEFQTINLNKIENYYFIKKDFSVKNFDIEFVEYINNISFVINVMNADILRKDKRYVDSFNLLYEYESDDNSLNDTRNKVSQAIVSDIKINLIGRYKPLDLFNSLSLLSLSKGYRHHKEFFDNNRNNTVNLLENEIDEHINNKLFAKSLVSINTLGKIGNLNLLSSKLRDKHYKSYNPFIFSSVEGLIKQNDLKQAKEKISDLNKVNETKETSKRLNEIYYVSYNPIIFAEVEGLIKQKKYEQSLFKIKELVHVNQTIDTSKKLHTLFIKIYNNDLKNQLANLETLIYDKKFDDATTILLKIEKFILIDKLSVKNEFYIQLKEYIIMLEYVNDLVDNYINYMFLKSCYESRKGYLLQYVNINQYNSAKKIMELIEKDILKYKIADEKKAWEKAELQYKDNYLTNYIHLDFNETASTFCKWNYLSFIDKGKKYSDGKIKKDF